MFFQTKYLFVSENRNIKDWLRQYNIKNKNIGWLVRGSADVQNNNVVFVTLKPSESVLKASNANQISALNLIVNCVFFTVRKVIEQTWINDRDQYLYPNDNWQIDTEFQNDCLTFTLFNTNILSSEGTNHWIPFIEQEVNAQAKFESSFMTDFMKGKIKPEATETKLFEQAPIPSSQALVFSVEAVAVFNAGRELWKYYHSQKGVNVNASLYDIREYFQGRNEKGRMNSKSDDVLYMKLIGDLRSKLTILADKIKPKVYEYEFLKE
jgi:hypothetical protein